METKATPTVPVHGSARFFVTQLPRRTGFLKTDEDFTCRYGHDMQQDAELRTNAVSHYHAHVCPWQPDEDVNPCGALVYVLRINKHRSWMADIEPVELNYFAQRQFSIEQILEYFNMTFPRGNGA
jgi:hypothetical protein